nr:unnamed protein product [Callosobruchus chinensis]CAH7730102.1 unnamed protein product [Callosobruchus chinensis]CAH7732386.1 unnamed protein product [Callosobruchus chinensis]
MVVEVVSVFTLGAVSSHKLSQ